MSLQMLLKLATCFLYKLLCFLDLVRTLLNNNSSSNNSGAVIGGTCLLRCGANSAVVVFSTYPYSVVPKPGTSGTIRTSGQAGSQDVLELCCT